MKSRRRRGYAENLAVVALLMVGPMLGCLRAVPAPQNSVPSKSVVEQLSELLRPQNVQVSSATISSAGSAGTRELRVQWVRGIPTSTPDQLKAGTPPIGVFSVAAQQRYAEAPPRQRSLEIAAGRVLIAAIDRNNGLKSWVVIPDPRIIRSEGRGPDGTLTGQTLHLEQAEFFLSVPDDPEIVELRIYEPQPIGGEYRLAPVGSFKLSR